MLATMDWKQRITVDPAILTGKPTIKGTRISVEFVLETLASGWSIDQVLFEHVQLGEEDIRACLAYASELLRSERVDLLPGA
jgi:uncharacterized protein (DUF433 family)